MIYWLRKAWQSTICFWFVRAPLYLLVAMVWVWFICYLVALIFNLLPTVPPPR